MKSGNWRERESRVLDHIGLYRLSLRSVIEAQFFAGHNAGNVIQRLLQDSRIQAPEQGFRGRLRYYQLTLTEARRRNLPEERAGNLGPQALHTHLGVLWFCCATAAPRRRLEDRELEKLFGTVPPGVAHCADAGRDPCIFRMHIVGQKTKVSDLIKRLRGRTLTAPENATVENWIANRKYGFAILAESDARCEAIRRAVNQAGFQDHVRFTVQCVPSPLTIHEAIHEYRAERLSSPAP